MAAIIIMITVDEWITFYHRLGLLSAHAPNTLGGKALIKKCTLNTKC